uniref:G domain-containing protein n=1 Tax=Panagrellus redivivus TaxID=6233 RepID=A0A7E4VWA4_PANRE
MSTLLRTTFLTTFREVRGLTLKLQIRSTTSVSLKKKVQERLAARNREEQLAGSGVKVLEADSLLAERLIENEKSSYSSIHRARKMATSKPKTTSMASETSKMRKSTENPSSFPYQISADPSLFDNAQPESIQIQSESHPNNPKLVPDKGFFVKGDAYMDEYIAATAADVPEDEMNECPYHFVGDENAIETIDFQMPGQQAFGSKDSATISAEDSETAPNDDWKANYGSADATSEVTVSADCTGCGAHLHCSDSALPGFVPVEVLHRVADIEAKNARRKSQIPIEELCRRCYMLKNHDFLLNVNICEVDYERAMGHLKFIQEALVLLIVDMTDIQGSIYRQLPGIIGDSKPMIVIGNKVDLLPPDAHPGYLKRFRTALNDALNESGLSQRFNVMHTALVSAKTGYGIEDLITKIYLNWINPKGALRNDMYLIGCTNAGKSTLFNAFLQSDLCKVRALDLVERVTTSVWPGTTLNLLKFPLMNPSAHKLELRRRRLLSQSAWAMREQAAKYALYTAKKDPKYLMLSGVIENTFKDNVDIANPMSNRAMNATISSSVDLENPEVDLEVPKVRHGVKLTDVEFTAGHWCFDTPGTVNRNQLLDVYTLDELITLVPRTLIIPRIAIVKPGQTLLIGGTARIDILVPSADDSISEEQNRVFLTYFGSEKVPINVMNTSNVDEFIAKYRGTKILAVPTGDEIRLNKFPRLQSSDYTIKNGADPDEACADISLSTIGWVSVTTSIPSVSVRIATPEGRGIHLRAPILPFAAKYRGARLPGSQLYKTKPFKFDGPVKQSRGNSSPRRRRR